MSKPGKSIPLRLRELHRLRVARRHRRGTPEEPSVEGAPLLQALLRSLDEIERIAGRILKLTKSRSRSGDITADLERLRGLMSLDVLPVMVEPGGEWYRRLQAGIHHDRALIHRLQHPPGGEIGKPPENIADSPPVAEFAIPMRERYGPVALGWHPELAAAGGELWLGHVASRIDDCARRHRLRTLTYRLVELRAAPPGGSAEALAIIRLSRDGHTATADVAPGVGAFHAILWFRTAHEVRGRSRSLLGSRAMPTWRELVAAPPGRTNGLLSDIVELLRQAETQRTLRSSRGGDPNSLLDDIRTYKEGPTHLLCRLEAEPDLLSPEVQQKVLQEAKHKLNTIIRNSDWPLLVRCFAPVVRRIAERSEYRDLYAAMWARAPHNPLLDDLRALALATRSLSLECPLLAFVQAACGSELAEYIVEEGGPEMRLMLAQPARRLASRPK